MNKSLGLTVLLVAFAGSAMAQIQVSGAGKCGKPETSQAVEAGDPAGHMFAIDKITSCTFTTPLELAGLKATAYSSAVATDGAGAKYQQRGYTVITMENGDKAYVRTLATSSMTEGGKAMTYEGTWSFTGGTGKLKGLKGKGTYKGSGVPGVENQDQIEGEYTLPEAGAAAK
jgi:hypothetical protein